MTTHRVVSPQEWLAARRQLLEKEKAFTRARDDLSRERRALPWERVEKTYVFETPKGQILICVRPASEPRFCTSPAQRGRAASLLSSRRRREPQAAPANAAANRALPGSGHPPSAVDVPAALA